MSHSGTQTSSCANVVNTAVSSPSTVNAIFICNGTWYVDRYSICLSKNKNRFQERKSTVTACCLLRKTGLLILTSTKILRVFFDIKKAFDSERLVSKLSAIDFHPLPLWWLTSYLTCRQQHVVINGTASKGIFVVSGVPQGSVLGHLLFDDISFFHCPILANSIYMLMTHSITKLYLLLWIMCPFNRTSMTYQLG